MKSTSEKLFILAGKVKTPLILSGLVVSVLYGIYKQILSLDVFENIGANSTFVILQSMLEKVFWLALISIVLGVASYLTTFVLSRKQPAHKSNVSLIDASLDPHNSAYEQNNEKGKKNIKPKGKETKR